MDELNPVLDTLWENLLSCQPDRVKLAFLGLSLDEKASILAHLNRMAEDAGWHPEQKASASAALAILSGLVESQPAPKSSK